MAAPRFVLAHPAITTVIPGANSSGQVRANVARLHADIPAALWSDVKAEGLIGPTLPSRPARFPEEITMLRGLDPLLSPELLRILRAMGHGDEIAIVDANYPASRDAKRLVRLDGADATQALQAILSVLPLDSFVANPAHCMQVVGKPDEVPPAVAEFQTVVDRLAGFPEKIGKIERFGFYDRAKTCYAVVATAERRLYGNIILTKGVIGADGEVVR